MSYSLSNVIDVAIHQYEDKSRLVLNKKATYKGFSIGAVYGRLKCNRKLISYSRAIAELQNKKKINSWYPLFL